MHQVVFPPVDVAMKIGISIGVGMLVGFEREWSNKDVGIRTFALVSLLGALAALIGLPYAIAAFIGVLLLTIVVNVRSIIVDRSLELTTSVALAVTCLLGVLVGLGHMFTPVASAILMTMLLAWKTELRRFAGGVNPEEIRSAVLLCLIGFVIYPILPDRYLDRWSLFNPREAWLIVIIIGAIGFVNYVLLRLYSTRGLYWSAALGGLVNSTATVAELSTTAARSGFTPRLSTFVQLTTLAMFVRNTALLLIFAPKALYAALLPLACMCLPTAIELLTARRRKAEEKGELSLSSPLSLIKVLKFALLFVAIEILGSLAVRYAGHLGFLAISVIGGFVSSASATAAAASLAIRGSVSAWAAGSAAILASMASAVVNVPLVARGAKDKSVTRRVALITVLQVAIGTSVLFAQRIWMK